MITISISHCCIIRQKEFSGKTENIKLSWKIPFVLQYSNDLHVHSIFFKDPLPLNGKDRRKAKKNCSDLKQELSLLNSFHQKDSILLFSVFPENSFFLLFTRKAFIAEFIPAKRLKKIQLCSFQLSCKIPFVLLYSNDLYPIFFKEPPLNGKKRRKVNKHQTYL